MFSYATEEGTKKGPVIPRLKGCWSKEARASSCVGGHIMCVCIFYPIAFSSSWSYHKFFLRHITHTTVENGVHSLVLWDRKWLWLTTKSWLNTADFHYACEALIPGAQTALCLSLSCRQWSERSRYTVSRRWRVDYRYIESKYFRGVSGAFLSLSQNLQSRWHSVWAWLDHNSLKKTKNLNILFNLM